MSFSGTKLRTLRETRPWSRLQLAKRLNVSDPQVGRWESGLAVPRPHMQVKIAKLFGIAVADLMGENNNQEQPV